MKTLPAIFQRKAIFGSKEMTFFFVYNSHLKRAALLLNGVLFR